MKSSDYKSAQLSLRPHLLRAVYNWCVENRFDPHVMVAGLQWGRSMVVTDYVENNRLILDISPDAVRYFKLDKEYMSFSTRFAGVIYEIKLDLRDIVAIYAQGLGIGTCFDLVEPNSEKLEKLDNVMIENESESAAPAVELELERISLNGEFGLDSSSNPASSQPNTSTSTTSKQKKRPTKMRIIHPRDSLSVQQETPQKSQPPRAKKSAAKSAVVRSQKNIVAKQVQSQSQSTKAKKGKSTRKIKDS